MAHQKIYSSQETSPLEHTEDARGERRKSSPENMGEISIYE
jgi:hypothetical protein